MKLGDALRGYRAVQVPSIGLREAAAQIDISPTTLSRIENGHVPDHKALVKIWGWLTFPDTSPSRDGEKRND